MKLNQMKERGGIHFTTNKIIGFDNAFSKIHRIIGYAVGLRLLGG